MSNKPLTAVIVGAGHRALLYASHAKHHSDELQIVGVADPLALRRQQAMSAFGFGLERCFESAAALTAAPKFADFVMNGTMDHQSVVVEFADGCTATLNMTGAHGGHGGGDLRLVGDFLAVLRGGTPSISSTSIEDSVNGHLLGFSADLSRETHEVVDVRARQR